MTKKRIVALLLLASICFASCSPAGAGSAQSGGNTQVFGNLDPQAPVAVELWHYYVGENQQALEAAVDSFNQTVGIEQGVVVEAVAMGSIAELEAAVTDAAKGVINAREMPQLFSSYPDKAMEIDALDMVVELNDYFTEEERQLYVQDFLADGTFAGGRLLVLPIVKSTELTYVNKTAWEEFAAAEGYTTEALATWESVYDTAKAYYNWTDAQTPDVAWDGTALMGFDSVANYIIIGNRQMGVDVIDAASGGAVIRASEMRRIFDLYYKGMTLGYFAAEGKFRSDDIKAGKLIAYVGSSSSAAYFPTWLEQNNTQQPIDFLPLSYPGFAGGEAYAIQQGAGMCVAESTPAQQEGAVLFLKWFTRAEENIPFAMTTGYLPVQQESYGSATFEAALQMLETGDVAQQNVAGVYGIALRQITEQSTYAAKPFEGSYSVRTILQQTLMDAALQDLPAAQQMQAEGAAEEEILDALGLNDRFEDWISAIKQALDQQGIPYTEG